MADQRYIGYEFKVAPLQPGTEILIAELGYAGFESFVENDEGVSAYIQEADWNPSILDDIHILKSNEFIISYQFNTIEQTNWNVEWETNFKPIVVDNLVTVRAPFHDKPNTKFDLIIEPKMSFGTGHHETTHMMIQHILQNDFKNKIVLDMGCGTGVLAILAEKVGATQVDAIDIDNWCYLNSIENVERNACNNISVYEGEVSLLKNQKYDIIIANINRNILLKDISIYAKHLKNSGFLFLSGFYDQDLDTIISKCEENKLIFEDKILKNSWVAAKFKIA
ncbi:MAG: 50S ribosomal protein L11 methyltransferase [Winogradskyella sp.]|uniref:50S ribosomal protein L11 methyltransferase n=1 Tax=Winogradskyella sp. TaxID=1883156 RepID=UPI0017A6B3EB|nr:50S ribosomal protein L11 methyltransferase [Winogradskyella sp.]